MILIALVVTFLNVGPISDVIFDAICWNIKYDNIELI